MLWVAKICSCTFYDGLVYMFIRINRYNRALVFLLAGGAAFSVSVGVAVTTNYLVYAVIRIAEYD